MLHRFWWGFLARRLSLTSATSLLVFLSATHKIPSKITSHNKEDETIETFENHLQNCIRRQRLLGVLQIEMVDDQCLDNGDGDEEDVYQQAHEHNSKTYLYLEMMVERLYGECVLRKQAMPALIFHGFEFLFEFAGPFGFETKIASRIFAWPMLHKKSHRPSTAISYQPISPVAQVSVTCQLTFRKRGWEHGIEYPISTSMQRHRHRHRHRYVSRE